MVIFKVKNKFYKNNELLSLFLGTGEAGKCIGNQSSSRSQVFVGLFPR